MVQSACDLDLLLFLARHTRSMLTSEQITRLLGYDLKELSASLELASTRAGRAALKQALAPDRDQGHAPIPLPDKTRRVVGE